jgi:hypothetical protein
MKLKILVIILALTLASVAQTGSQPTTPAPDAKACACCNHDKAETGAKGGCCKDGKCPMMSGKCPMMSKNEKKADGKMCCSSNQCPMHPKGGNPAACCCGNMDEHHQGM